MLRILGKSTSINVRKVLWTCVELSQPYELEQWGSGFRETSDAAFLALNPNALVPERTTLARVDAYYERLSERPGFLLHGRNGVP